MIIRFWLRISRRCGTGIISLTIARTLAVSRIQTKAIILGRISLALIISGSI